MRRTGRNELCKCGSGKKFKKCCISQGQSTESHSKLYSALIEEAGMMAMLDRKKSRESAIEQLKAILSVERLSKTDFTNATFSMAVAYQHQGEHKNAISALETIECSDESDLSEKVTYQLAVSYGALGYTEHACELFQSIIDNWNSKPASNTVYRHNRGLMLIEAGKAFSSDGDNLKAIDCWEQSIKLLEEFSEREAEHIGRARANLSLQKLYSEEESTQNEGVEELNLSTNTKLKIGDMKGVANNYCNLGNYFRKEKRYGRAIAYYRKDLYLSRLIGDKRDLASTLGNFSTIYADLKQFKQAKKILAEAKAIGVELNDERLLHISESQLDYVNNLAKEAGLNKIGIGDKALCGCDSGKLYNDCCGMADFEPVNLSHIYGGLSEEAAELHEEFSILGITPCPLDFILRKIPEGSLRRSWMEHHLHDGWVSIAELPDMASIHMFSAREMLKKALDDNDLSSALATVILSVCYLEAFINQISFFLYQNKEDDYICTLNLPDLLMVDGPFNYQRKSSLETKWQEISDCLNGGGWLSSQREWQQVKDVIHIRNEFVHFKSNGCEQVVPPPRKKEAIYSKIPQSVELKDVPHSWPFKFLTGSLARWAIESAEGLVDVLKSNYAQHRRHSPKSAISS
ncbi:tetratricopeptide repeat protein [Pseudomonas viridiflava]